MTESNDNEVSQLDQALSVENKKLKKVCENMKGTHARTHARTHAHTRSRTGGRKAGEEASEGGERERNVCEWAGVHPSAFRVESIDAYGHECMKGHFPCDVEHANSA